MPLVVVSCSCGRGGSGLAQTGSEDTNELEGSILSLLDGWVVCRLKRDKRLLFGVESMVCGGLKKLSQILCVSVVYIGRSKRKGNLVNDIASSGGAILHQTTSVHSLVMQQSRCNIEQRADAPDSDSSCIHSHAMQN